MIRRLGDSEDPESRGSRYLGRIREEEGRKIRNRKEGGVKGQEEEEGRKKKGEKKKKEAGGRREEET